MYILRDLWYGKVAFHERRGASGEFKKALSQFTKSDVEFRQQLTMEQQDAFIDYEEAQVDFYRMKECDAFMQGFRIGARILMDVLNEDDPHLQPIAPP